MCGVAYTPEAFIDCRLKGDHIVVLTTGDAFSSVPDLKIVVDCTDLSQTKNTHEFEDIIKEKVKSILPEDDLKSRAEIDFLDLIDQNPNVWNELNDSFAGAEAISEMSRLDKPPLCAQMLLDFLVVPARRPEVIGDLDELYHERILPAYGKWTADYWYWQMALRLIWPLLKRSVWHQARRLGLVAGFAYCCSWLFEKLNN